MAANGTNGSGPAYTIHDHAFDVVIVGAGGAGLRATVGCSRGGPAHRLHHQGVPDPLAHRGGAGRHLGLARQHGPGRLALAHVRHREGVGLARRPGRDRVPRAQRPGRRVRAGALGRAVLPHGGGQDLPAPVRRHDHRLRQGHRPAHLRGGRPHRPRHAAHPLRAGGEEPDRLLHRVLRPRPDHGRGGPLPRRHRPRPGHRRDPPLPRPDDDPGHRRLWPRLLLGDLRPYLHRRRQRHGAARRPAAAGHGVRAVPPDRHLRRRLPHHRRLPRRGRLPDEFRGRALHGALRALGQGPRLARRGLALDDHGDPRRPRRRQGQGPHLPAPRPSRPEDPARAPAGHLGDRPRSSRAST